MTNEVDEARTRRARWGAWLIALGIVGILWGVFHVLDRVGSPSAREFSERLTYNQVKPRVQAAFLGGLLRALAGLGLALVGGRMRALALRDGSDPRP